MTTEQALRMALEALEEISTLYMSLPKKGCMALAAIEEVLAQPEYSATSDHRLMENAQGDLERITLVQTGVGIGQPERPAVQGEPDRAAFERHWKKVRGHKKSDRELKRHPLQPQTYVQDSANRHWVTWQAATRCAATPQPAVPEQEPIITKNEKGLTLHVGWDDLPVGTKLYTTPQPAVQGEPVEYWTVADGWVSEQAEVPAAVWVEPDFWEHCNRVNCGTAYRLPAPGRQPLYTTPQPAVPERKPLSDEEIKRMAAPLFMSHYWNLCNEFARAIEAAHQIGVKK